MNRAKVSVIIPVYNVESYLERCMNSVLGQTLTDIEVILINDGSTDSSGALCDEYARRDSRVRVRHRENAGAGLARNDGIDLATGEYAAFMDSDDYIDPAMYETLYLAGRDHGADAMIGGYYQVKNGRIIEEKNSSIPGLYQGPDAMKEFYLEVLGADAACKKDFRVLWRSPCLSLYSMDLIRAHGIRFDSERTIMSEDHLFNMEFFSRAECVCVLPQAFFYRCINTDSISHSYSFDLHQKSTALYREQLRRLEKMGYSDAYIRRAKERLQRNYLAHTRASVRNICRKTDSYSQAGDHLRAVLSAEELQTVLREYPWRKNPFMQRLFNFGLRYRLTGFVYFLMRLKT